MSVSLAQQNLNIEALDFINKAIEVNKRQGVAHSTKGNILQNLGRNSEAVISLSRAIQLQPGEAEAYGNLGNVQQDLLNYDSALKSYEAAIARDPGNADFYCNLGNCFVAMKNDQQASIAYFKAIQLDANHADAHYYLSHLRLKNFDFVNGWGDIEWRWKSSSFNSVSLSTSKKRWAGQKISGTLFVWAEQGIGDQILYSSFLNEVKELTTLLIVSVEEKLLPVMRQSFSGVRFISKLEVLSENDYDYQIPIGSIGQFFIKSAADFQSISRAYLSPNKSLVKKFRESLKLSQKLLCGISWRSSNPILGLKKSMSLAEMSLILDLKDHIEFINLQYGDTELEISNIKKSLDSSLIATCDVDLFRDMEGLLALIDICNVVITTSNSVAHLSGAAGKETLLLLPYSAGKFWYWHDVNGKSLWYPSIKIFRQKNQGDWHFPVTELKKYLEKKIAV
jgi:tetratricopeptide (TPR) repeat protein